MKATEQYCVVCVVQFKLSILVPWSSQEVKSY